MRIRANERRRRGLEQDIANNKIATRAQMDPAGCESQCPPRPESPPVRTRPHSINAHARRLQKGSATNASAIDRASAEHRYALTTQQQHQQPQHVISPPAAPDVAHGNYGPSRPVPVSVSVPPVATPPLLAWPKGVLAIAQLPSRTLPFTAAANSRLDALRQVDDAYFLSTSPTSTPILAPTRPAAQHHHRRLALSSSQCTSTYAVSHHASFLTTRKACAMHPTRSMFP